MSRTESVLKLAMTNLKGGMHLIMGAVLRASSDPPKACSLQFRDAKRGSKRQPDPTDQDGRVLSDNGGGGNPFGRPFSTDRPVL